jgi:hypothetical protein
MKFFDDTLRLVLVALISSMLISMPSSAEVNRGLGDECTGAVETLEKYLDYQDNSIGPLVGAKNDRIKLITDFIGWCIKLQIISVDDLR